MVSKHKKDHYLWKHVQANQTSTKHTALANIMYLMSNNVKNDTIYLIFLLSNFYSFFEMKGRKILPIYPTTEKTPLAKPQESPVLKISDFSISHMDAWEKWASFHFYSFAITKKKRNTFWVFLFGAQNSTYYIILYNRKDDDNALQKLEPSNKIEKEKSTLLSKLYKVVYEIFKLCYQFQNYLRWHLLFPSAWIVTYLASHHSSLCITNPPKGYLLTLQQGVSAVSKANVIFY